MHADASEHNPYLQQEVLSASPFRLRWMLIKRAEELCGMVNQIWLDGRDDQANQWILRIRDILGELLAGVQDGANPVGQKVADFYVFLLQLLAEIQDSRSMERMDILRELLGIEAETWQMVVDKMNSDTSADAHPVGVPAARSAPMAPPISASSMESFSGEFSLEV